ncbi:MAG TPA: GyrI-like domain-containing protein [Syntrophorhabdales bacterium]|nr:GyrI-like domain-containing protein [Syntrophorhabdales bacterium]
MIRKESDENGRAYLRKEYIRRINRVIDYIEANLDKDLSLETLSEVACFSRYHFHRLFGAVIGEPLGQFIQRVRLERAASKLIHNPLKSITQVANECGFSSSAGFARAFREAFGMSARVWRAGGHRMNSNLRKDESNSGKMESKTRKDYAVPSLYIESNVVAQTWRLTMREKPEITANVEIKEIREMEVAYVRHIGSYSGDSRLYRELIGKLMRWAGPRGLLRIPDTKLLFVYYDNPGITDEARLRTDVCITVPEGTPAEGEIGRMAILGGRYAVAHFEITPDHYSDAWNGVYGGWLPESGYQPDERPAFEIHLNEPEEHPEGKHIVEIHVPVKPL